MALSSCAAVVITQRRMIRQTSKDTALLMGRMCGRMLATRQTKVRRDAAPSMHCSCASAICVHGAVPHTSSITWCPRARPRPPKPSLVRECERHHHREHERPVFINLWRYQHTRLQCLAVPVQRFTRAEVGLRSGGCVCLGGRPRVEGVESQARLIRCMMSCGAVDETIQGRRQQHVP